MSISRSSARAKARAWLGAGAWMALSGACVAEALAAPTAKLVSQAEAASMARAAQGAVQQQDDLPNDSASTVAWIGPLRRDSQAGSGRIVGLATVRFKGVTNRYCRVFVSSGEPRGAMIVPVTAAANHDRCLGAGPLHVLDLDGDGQADLVHTVSVPSNRTSATVSETVVYLGRREAPSGFCYSADASRELAGADARTDASLATAASGALKRLGGKGFSCARP